MGEGDKVRCYFTTPDKAAKAAGKCDGDAAGFVRVKHSGRLCPLCGPCRDSFVAAQDHMSDESRKALPGGASFKEVGLEAGTAEYAAQAPKTK